MEPAIDKKLLRQLLTVYGRKPVQEILEGDALPCYALHIATSNRTSKVIDRLVRLAERRSIPIKHHSRQELARISKNGKQDQGVALDVICPDFQSAIDHLKNLPTDPSLRLIALDGITNPQNLGMIIRSIAAGAIDGLLLSSKGNAALGPLTIKASAGTVFRAPIISCDALNQTLRDYKRAGAKIYTLEGDANTSLFTANEAKFSVFVLGNETEGVSANVSKLADEKLRIPMRNGVESLNVAVAASLIAFAPYFDR